MAWTRDDVERWLNDYPLPKDFVFRGEKVWPRYQLKKGYGFWLKTAGPYHVALRGLFQLCVQLIQEVPVGAPMPSPDELAARIRYWETLQAELPMSLEDQAPALGSNPAEDTDQPL